VRLPDVGRASGIGIAALNRKAVLVLNRRLSPVRPWLWRSGVETAKREVAQKDRRPALEALRFSRCESATRRAMHASEEAETCG